MPGILRLGRSIVLAAIVWLAILIVPNALTSQAGWGDKMILDDAQTRLGSATAIAIVILAILVVDSRSTRRSIRNGEAANLIGQRVRQTAGISRTGRMHDQPDEREAYEVDRWDEGQPGDS